MAAAAARHGVDKQYGGHISSGFLHSDFLPNARTARVGADYIPARKRPPNTCNGADVGLHTPPHNVLIARNALFPWALGIRPYKDAFLSGPQRWANTTCFARPHGGPAGGGSTVVYPEWYGLQERYPELQALVSALLAGPVAVGDGIGDTDASLMRRLSRSDGVLLKPDLPMVPLDAVWMRDAFGPKAGGVPGGEIAATYTTIAASVGGVSSSTTMRWDYVYATALTADYAVTAKDGAVGTAAGLAWKRAYGEPFGTTPTLVPFGGAGTKALSLAFPAQKSADEWGEYTLWRTAPVSCAGGGWALLGELDKLISVSPQRIAYVTQHCGGDDGTGMALTVGLTGAPGEAVALSFATADGGVVKVVRVVLDTSGKGEAKTPPRLAES
jgi:hypothetical protein